MEIINAQKILFDGIKDIHSDAGLNEIVQRFIANRERLKILSPKIYMQKVQ